MKKIITTENSPAPIGPYSQAVLAHDTLYISGQIAIDPVSGKIIDKSIEEETHQVMKNLKAVLESTGYSFNNIVKTSIFLSDMDFFTGVNQVYGQYFDGEFPARETLAVKTLPKNVNVEISAIAVKF
ncbi:reactive intermediate/imine deaminase [Pedobacter psychrophilus]|uniref:Reactive intermediate/imine deaminase n=1 Tax=Pedobacter psychrophilus TaxID=1826909 RepID=A0A179DHA9_9SPHI|nr:RidA family protein [Pedobacter psychrophilus]OAQ40466.1 reactive intermediate/imine deaminase [Pedobacter psychrophilus]